MKINDEIECKSDEKNMSYALGCFGGGSCGFSEGGAGRSDIPDTPIF